MIATGSKHAPQRGAASLIVVMLLLLAMLLTAAGSERAQLFDQKASVNQMRAAQAFEAAEAGQAWALAALNAPRLDADCEPDAAGTLLREHVLRREHPGATAFATSIDPRRSAIPACTADQTGWHCGCPARGRAAPVTEADDRPHPGFSVAFAGAAREGAVRITSHGCAQLGRQPCDIADASLAGHVVTVSDAALVPALAARPPATLTAGANVDFAHAAVVLRNPDPRTGVALLTGGTLAAGALQVLPPAGTPPGSALITNDATIAARADTPLLTLHLGMPLASFAALPGVMALQCTLDCAAPALAAWRQGYRMLYAAGDLQIDAGELGSADEPVLLVVGGRARLGPRLHLTGALIAAELQWAGGQAWLHGAAVVGGDVSANGSVELVYDPAVLEHLETDTGTYVRVPGSWTDAT